MDIFYLPYINFFHSRKDCEKSKELKEEEATINFSTHQSKFLSLYAGIIEIVQIFIMKITHKFIASPLILRARNEHVVDHVLVRTHVTTGS